MKKQLIKMMSLCTIIGAISLSAIAQQTTPEQPKASDKGQAGANQPAQTAPKPIPPMTPEEQQKMMAQRQAANAQQRIDARLKSMKEKLALTDEQTAKVKSLFEAQEKQTQEYMEQMRKQQQKMNDDLAKILTPEQMEKYKQAPPRPQMPAMGASPKQEEKKDAPAPAPKDK